MEEPASTLADYDDMDEDADIVLEVSADGEEAMEDGELSEHEEITQVSRDDSLKDFWFIFSVSVVDPNTMNLYPDPGFLPKLDPDPA